MNWCIFSLLFLTEIIANPAHADVYNRQILPLGEGAAFMANTGTGGAVNTAAVYYNPAALAGISHSRMAVTGSTYLSFGIKADGIARIDSPPQNIPYEARGFNTIPASYILTFAMDEAVVAFSVLVPDSLQLEDRSAFTSPNTKGILIESFHYNDLWLGGSYAKRIDDRWSVGATLFGVLHSDSALAETVIDFPNTANSMASSTSRYDASVVGLSLNLGVLYEFSPEVSVGLRVQTPLLNISNKADTLVNTRYVDAGVLTAVDEDRPSAIARYQLPLDTTIGARFHPTEGWNIYTDISFQVGTNYNGLPGSSIDSEINTDATFRYAVGTEIKLSEKIPARFGAFYNPSALHQFRNNGKSQTKIDYFGVTGGLAYIIEHIETSVGAFYISGNGKSTLDGVPGNEANYVTTGLGALISTSYNF